jgi:hypothetical protein
MNVTELISALQTLKPDTPVSRELLAELAPVDEHAIYGGGAAHFHPSIYQFRRQRYVRAASAAARAIAKLRDAGWDARVTRNSIGDETSFIEHVVFVIVPTASERAHDSLTFEEQDAAEQLIKDEMAGWPYGVDSGWMVMAGYHRENFDAALSVDDIERTLRKDVDVLSREILRLADISAATRAYLLSQGPILYVDEAQFPGEIVREWPDGRREIVRRNNDGKLVVVRTIMNKSSKES